MSDAQQSVPQTQDGQTPAPQPPDADRSIGELLSDMTNTVTTLLRKEIEMARLELEDEIRKAAKAGGMLSGGALSGYLSLLFGSFGLAWLLDRKLPRPLAFFTVAALHGAAAAALLAKGRQEMLQVEPIPSQTVESVKESVEWAKAQAVQGASG